MHLSYVSSISCFVFSADEYIIFSFGIPASIDLKTSFLDAESEPISFCDINLITSLFGFVFIEYKNSNSGKLVFNS